MYIYAEETPRNTAVRYMYLCTTIYLYINYGGLERDSCPAFSTRRPQLSFVGELYRQRSHAFARFADDCGTTTIPFAGLWEGPLSRLS